MAQIEKEALALLLGLERFDQYTYGRKVIIQNDHKPLETILKKNVKPSSKENARHYYETAQIRRGISVYERH